MNRLFGYAAVAVAVLAGGTAAQAQHGHSGHSYGHSGHSYGHSGQSYGHGISHGYAHGFGYGGIAHVHGHMHYWPSAGYYGSYGYGYPYASGAVLSAPAYSYPSVVANPVVAPAATVVPAGGVTSSTSLKPNALPPYAGPGVTLRLPAEFPGSVFVQVDGREVEIKPGTEMALKDKGAYRVVFDKGAEFGTASSEVSEGVYRFAVGDRGWHLLPDDPAAANGGLRRNALPGEAKK